MNIIKTIKNKMERYRDKLLIQEDMLLSMQNDIERSIDYFSEYIGNGNKIVANNNELVLDKIAALKQEEALINAELNKINRKMDSLFYKLINKICGDYQQEYDIPDEYYIEQAKIIFK